MRSAKFIGWELMADSGRLWRSTGVAALWAILGLGLTCSFPVAAQEPDAADQTNDVTAAEVLARITEMIQSAESGQPEEMAAPDDLAATNALPRANGPAQDGSRSGKESRSDSSSRPDSTNRSPSSSRSQTDDRRSRGRRSSRSKSDQPRSSASAGDYSRSVERGQANAFPRTNGALARLDYSAFKVIVDQNIFDPNRYPRKPGEPRPRTAPRTVDSLTLVGTMSYERGAFAFFDGSSSEYKKALKLTDAIAGYKVSNITPNAVKLAAGTNELELPVGMQLRREEDGPWLLASHSGSYAPAPALTPTNAAATATATGTNAPSGSAEAESDIIKKLMQRREQ